MNMSFVLSIIFTLLLILVFIRTIVDKDLKYRVNKMCRDKK